MSHDDFMGPLIAFLFAVALLIGVYAYHSREEQGCEERGGHMVARYLYKSTLRLCISQDGRILE